MLSAIIMAHDTMIDVGSIVADGVHPEMRC